MDFEFSSFFFQFFFQRNMFFHGLEDGLTLLEPWPLAGGLAFQRCKNSATNHKHLKFLVFFCFFFKETCIFKVLEGGLTFPKPRPPGKIFKI